MLNSTLLVQQLVPMRAALLLRRCILFYERREGECIMVCSTKKTKKPHVGEEKDICISFSKMVGFFFFTLFKPSNYVRKNRETVNKSVHTS